MKLNRLFLWIVLLCCAGNIVGQNKLTLREMKAKTDSILAEAETLYQFEKAAWIATDSARVKAQLRLKLGSYLVYQTHDTVKVVFLNRAVNSCLYELIFSRFVDVPIKQIITERPLTAAEQQLIEVRVKALKQIADREYPLTCPEGFNLNIQLIPYEKGYKLYFLTGTGQMNIIPFGNDYLFFTDKTGNIVDWRKLHSTMLAQPVAVQGQKVRSLIHSHLAGEPFIAATDICTFRLYGSYYDLNEFSVYSPALSLEFIYKMKTNSIELSQK